MVNVLSELNMLRKKCDSIRSDRILSQLEYAVKVSKVRNGEFNSLIRKTVEFLSGRFEADGTITRPASEEAEKILSKMSHQAKSFKVICAAHAHIDMNWMWGFPETVAITLDTFRTILCLMDEYSVFKFSQSQASVYKIVEEYDPAMLNEIKRRIREGRWEVTASTWVETDKNMPNGESLARHILYTKRTLSEMLGIQPESLEIDFEPDTFGHNRNVPEILQRGGVKYYYHCRGYKKHSIYQWRSPSGSTVLVYREPNWYNAFVKPSMVMFVPEFCTGNGIDTALKVYGVGNHGGGPTRRDIERIIEMSSWPVFPEIRFGTFSEFFKILDKSRDNFPVEENELNFVFTGCYTTQARIKMGNRISEAKLYEAEAFSAISCLFANGEYRADLFEKAWKSVLFNHFHDILPGSGVTDTREYAMGLYQKSIAAANSEISNTIRNISSQIDTSGLFPAEEDYTDTMSEGAGVGFGISDHGVPHAERGKGKSRIYHFFNPSPYERREVVNVTVWDWPGDPERITVKDAEGREVSHQVVEKDSGEIDGRYWDHGYITVLIDTRVPAFGYYTVVLSEKAPEDIKVVFSPDPRLETPINYTLENELIRAEFDPQTAAIVSLIDKKTGKEMISRKNPGGVFRLVEEDDVRGMTAWIIGRYMRIHNLNHLDNVKIAKPLTGKNLLRQWLKYEIMFNSSRLKVTISLDYHLARLDYEVECDWQERPVKGTFIPQLNFYLPLTYDCIRYGYDIPFGTIERDGADMDVPANSWIMGIPEHERQAVMITTQTKYGFRGDKNALAVTLIRSSYSPDPYPELGIHNIKFAVCVTDCLKNLNPVREAFDYNHPVKFISGTVHNGRFPLEKGFIALKEGSIAISSVKFPENRTEKDAVIIRVYETEGTKTTGKMRFPSRIKNACYVDINENKITSDKDIYHEDSNLVFETGAYSVTSIYVEFDVCEK